MAHIDIDRLREVVEHDDLAFDPEELSHMKHCSDCVQIQATLRRIFQTRSQQKTTDE